MSFALSSRDEARLVATLRSAGCVFAEDEARVLITAAGSAAGLAAMVDRRIGGLPLEQVVGFAEFHGLRIAVEPGVFVPRRRTGLIVDRAAVLARPGAVVVDLCCGSGALGVALAAVVGGVELHAADVEPAAVRCARRNLAAVGGAVYEGDLFAALPGGLRGRVDVLLANVPYVPTDEVGLLAPEARLHEPRRALDGGPDGLDVLRRVAAEAPSWLADGGCLLTETSDRQSRAGAAVLARHGLRAEVVTDDELGATVLVGTKGQAVGGAVR